MDNNDVLTSDSLILIRLNLKNMIVYRHGTRNKYFGPILDTYVLCSLLLFTVP